jgi:CRP-like cAMP-binding protein
LFLQQEERRMKNIVELLKEMPLFQGIESKELDSLLNCLSGRERKYEKSEVIFRAGDTPKYLGVVLEGGVRVFREDLLGNRVILGEFGQGDLFGETFALAKADALPVTVTATQTSKVLLIEGWRLTGTCPRCCGFHTRLIENMMAILAGKNMMLSEKMEVLSKRSTRDKLLGYLLGQSQRAGSLTFTIPFNRQELADYLCVDRSAMSSELGRLQNEGILTCDRSSFTLHKELDPS